ncbi:MAG: hypothetical protein AAFP92_24935 [Bacteroidota bacterium]
MVTSKGNIFYKTSAGYYCVINPSKGNRIEKVGYFQGNRLMSGLPIIDMDPENDPDDKKLYEGLGEELFSAFLLKMYGERADINIDCDILPFHLTSEMEAAGRIDYTQPTPIDDFAQVNPLDFMFLLGGKHLPQGLKPYLATNPDRIPAPLLSEVEDKDKTAMFHRIEHFGLWGMLPHLFVAGGISFDELIFMLNRQYPPTYQGNESREKHFYQVFEVIRVTATLAPFTPSEIDRYIYHPYTF